MNATQELDTIRASINQARERVGQRQAELDRARALRDQNIAHLKETYGVETPEEARAKIVQIEEKIAADLAAVRELLTEGSTT